MPLKPWPIVTDALYGEVPIGLFPSKDTNSELVLLPFGGLLELCTLTNCSELRAGWSWNNSMYWLVRRGSTSVLFQVDTAGGVTEIGTIATSYTGPAWIRNNQSQLAIVDGVGLYVYTPATNNFTRVLNYTPASDGALPVILRLDYQDGMGLLVEGNSNRWLITAINDFTTIRAQDFYSKQALTDDIQTIRAFKREPYIFGVQFGTEQWYNAGGDNNSVQTPTFARNNSGLINYGAASPQGETDMAGTGIIFLSSQGQLIQASGTTDKVASNGMFDREVAGDGTSTHPGYSTIADCIAFSYRDQGHIFGQWTFPTADVTWVYDSTTGLLLKRRSYKASGGYGRHRANCYVLHNGKHYVGDFENGKIYEMSTNYLNDDGHAIQRVLYSQDINGGKQLISFPPVQVQVEAGMGLAGGADPQMGLEFSKDGGKTWSNMVTRSAGLTGDYVRQANWNQMGSGYRRMYRLTLTDAILWRVLGIDFGI